MASNSRSRRKFAYLAASILVIWICFEWGVLKQTEPPAALDAGQTSGHSPTDTDPRILRVCADPNNLPYTNDRGEGFDNKIAELLAQELGRSVAYYWQPERRGFARTTIHARHCDVLINVPSTLERLRTTRPYYRSAYVFVTRRDRGLNLRSFEDSRLGALRIGIQVAGDDDAGPPSARTLAARYADQLRSYRMYGEDSRPRPQREIVDAVANGDIDVAVVWGPLAGYFATRQKVPLTLAPVHVRHARTLTPFGFDMSVAVRTEDWTLHAALDAAIAKRSSDIRDILMRYGVPLVTGT